MLLAVPPRTLCGSRVVRGERSDLQANSSAARHLAHQVHLPADAQLRVDLLQEPVDRALLSTRACCNLGDALALRQPTGDLTLRRGEAEHSSHMAWIDTRGK